MKIIELEQGSPEWLSWRKTVITGTDCPAILGTSPWSTAYKCWQRKMGYLEEQKMNDAMQRGKRLEPEARIHFVENQGINMSPTVVESTEFDFLGASLDGLSSCGKYLLEIKCGGSKLHDMAMKGDIPEYYQHQIQHQLFVTGAEKAFYYSYDGSSGVCIEVLPDPEFKGVFLPKARDFWKCVAFNEPPELQDSDYKDMSEDAEWISTAESYKSICAQIKCFEDMKTAIRNSLIDWCEGQNCSGGGIKVFSVTKRGRVDYDKIPGLKGVDLEPYRKNPTTSWIILPSKS